MNLPGKIVSKGRTLPENNKRFKAVNSWFLKYIF